MVPEGPSDGMRAESSTIVMSPPPFPAVGSTFIAGFGRAMVWRLPQPYDTSFCFSGARMMTATKSPNILARAEAGMRAPRTSRRDMRVAAGRADLNDVYFIARGCAEPVRESLFFLNCISRFRRTFHLLPLGKGNCFCPSLI